jgi:hypothetical protein
MNSEEWEYVRNRMEDCIGYPVELLIEGRRICLRLRRLTVNKLGIGVFIDGRILGEWLMTDCPERRFFQPVETHVYSQRHRSPAYRKLAKKLKIDVDAKHTRYRSWFSSFKALKRHYQATFPEIELIMEAA